MAKPARRWVFFFFKTRQQKKRKKEEEKNTQEMKGQRMEAASRSMLGRSFPQQRRCVCGHGVTPRPDLRAVAGGVRGCEVAAAVKHFSRPRRQVFFFFIFKA